MTQKSKGTLFWILNYGSSIRNIVRGGVLQEIAKRGYQLVLFCENAEDERIARENLGDAVSIERLGEVPYRGLVRTAQRLRTYKWRTVVEYNEHLIRQGKRRRFKHAWQDFLGKTVLRLVPRALWEWISDSYAEWPNGGALLEKYRPVGMVLSNPVAPENNALNWCKKRGVYTAWMVESWDNLTNRGATYGYPHDIIVWNRLIKQQAVDQHGFPEDHVHPVGLASFDIYFHDGAIPSEKDWREREGLPAGGPIILYSAVSLGLYDGEDVIIRRLHEAREAGQFPRDAHILVRAHPRDDIRKYEEILKLGGISLQMPKQEIHRINDPSYGNPERLAATVRYSSVVINVFSTMCLDALANNTPVVFVGFDVHPKPIQDSVRKHLHFQHVKELMEFGAIPLAKDPEDLVAQVRTFLENPGHLRERRQALLEAEIFKLDGRSAERAAETLDRQIQAHAAQKRSA
jgi:hypothetical protein